MRPNIDSVQHKNKGTALGAVGVNLKNKYWMFAERITWQLVRLFVDAVLGKLNCDTTEKRAWVGGCKLPSADVSSCNSLRAIWYGPRNGFRWRYCISYFYIADRVGELNSYFPICLVNFIAACNGVQSMRNCCPFSIFWQIKLLFLSISCSIYKWTWNVSHCFFF